MRWAAVAASAWALAACAGAPESDSAANADGDSAAAADSGPEGASHDPADASGAADAGSIATDAGGGDGSGDAGDGSLSAACTGDTLDANRNRLLDSYYAYLKASVTQPQTNGLSGANVTSSADVWQKLDPSSRDVFLTLTARLQGSKLGADSSSMLAHVVRIYRIAGGQGATATSPGSCGGGEYNRMIMSMDATLQATQLAANQHQGALQANGHYDIADVVSSSYWRNSHDVGGPHSPFDLSDETNSGAPRGQTQYFSDPTSTIAKSPLGRQDLMTLVDPYALEMDQDYDCVHNSNPDCTYVTYGTACLPQASEPGTQVYTGSYGSFEPSWQPQPCGP